MDLLTGEPAQGWVGEDLAINIGIFDQFGVSVDLENLQYLEVDIFPYPVPNQNPLTNFTYNQYSVLPFPNTPPAPLLFVTVPAADIEPTVSKADWLNGTDQQATATFTWVQTSSLELNGQPSRRFWMVVHGITSTGTKLTYGGSIITFYESGQQSIYLPNAAAPLLIPENTIFYLPPNTQIPYAETIEIEGTLEVDGGTLTQVSQL